MYIPFSEMTESEQWLLAEIPGENHEGLIEAVERQEKLGGYEVVLTINGIEFDFRRLAATLEKVLDAMVERRAADMLGNQVYELQEKCNRISRLLKEAEQDVIREFKIEHHIFFPGDDE